MKLTLLNRNRHKKKKKLFIDPNYFDPNYKVNQDLKILIIDYPDLIVPPQKRTFNTVKPIFTGAKLDSNGIHPLYKHNYERYLKP